MPVCKSGKELQKQADVGMAGRWTSFWVGWEGTVLFECMLRVQVL